MAHAHGARLRRGWGAVTALAVLSAALIVVVGSAPPGAADGNEAPGAPAVFRSLAAGSSHSCAILPDRSMRCWGSGTSGKLGMPVDGDRGDDPGEMGAQLPAIDLGTGRTATAITAGWQHTCAVLDDGTVKCWGRNDHGQLGRGNTEPAWPGTTGDLFAPIDLGAGRTATAITAGSEHTCAVLDDGTVKCWGRNDHGQLGLGDVASRGAAPDQMGDDLPAVDLGNGRTATAITAGHGHTCALLDNGTVKCWGRNDYGQLGLGDTESRGNAPGQMGDNLPAVDLGTGRTATAITNGDLRTCALLDDGTIKCWGRNESGNLGLGDTADRGDAPGEMGDDLPAVDLGTGRTATGVTAGTNHTCALLDNGTIKCWGSNGSALGIGDTSPRGDTPDEMGDNLPAVDLGTGRTATAVTAATSGGHTCAVIEDTALKCWGSNLDGQLGQGDMDDRGGAPGEMGDALRPIDLGVLTIAKTADQTNVVAGGPIDYHLTVTNHGVASITDIDVDDPGAPDCGDDPVFDLAGGASTTIDCTYVTGPADAGTYTNIATAVGDLTALVTSNSVALAVAEPAPSLTITKAADQTSVITGDPVDYHVTVTNTGNVALTGVTIDDDAAPDCERVVSDLAVSATHTVDCTHTPAEPADVGTYTNVAIADSDQTEPVPSNAVDVTVAARHQPDAALRKKGGPRVGRDVHNTDATGQKVVVTRAPGGAVTFFMTVENDGHEADQFAIRRIGPTTPALRVRYFAGRSDVDVTDAVLARTYRTRELAPGETATVRIEVTVRAGAASGSAHEIRIRARSETATTQADTILAKVRTA